MKRLPVILTLVFSSALQAHPDPAHTLAEIDRHLSETPDEPLLLRRKGELLLRAGRTDLAMNVVSKGLEKSAGDSVLLLLRARILTACGDTDEAFRQTLAITRNEPSFPEAWNELARLHYGAGRHDEAIAAKLRHLEADPRPGPGDFLVASEWLKNRGSQDDILTARTILDRGILIYPSLTALQQAAIRIECDATRFESALERVHQLVARHGPSVRFSLLRAGILEAAGRYEEAAIACDSALALLDLAASPPESSARTDIVIRKQQNLDRIAPP